MITGWNRTVLLAFGAFIGVLLIAFLIHISKVGLT